MVIRTARDSVEDITDIKAGKQPTTTGFRSQMRSSTRMAMANISRHGSFLLGRWYPSGSRMSPRKPQNRRGSALVIK